MAPLREGSSAALAATIAWAVTAAAQFAAGTWTRTGAWSSVAFYAAVVLTAVALVFRPERLTAGLQAGRWAAAAVAATFSVLQLADVDRLFASAPVAGYLSIGPAAVSGALLAAAAATPNAGRLRVAHRQRGAPLGGVVAPTVVRCLAVVVAALPVLSMVLWMAQEVEGRSGGLLYWLLPHLGGTSVVITLGLLAVLWACSRRADSSAMTPTATVPRSLTDCVAR